MGLPTFAKMGLSLVKLIIHIVGFLPQPLLLLSECHAEVTEGEGGGTKALNICSIRSPFQILINYHFHQHQNVAALQKTKFLM